MKAVWHSLVVAAILLTTGVAGAAPALVTAPSADVRSAPANVAPVLETFKFGSKVSVEETANNGWRRIRLHDNRIGYVRDAEIRLESAIPPAEPPAPPPAPAFPTVPATVKVFDLKARSAPATVAPVLQTFPEGKTLDVSKDEADGWRRTKLADGRVAFVSNTEIEVSSAAPDAVAAPVPAATPTPTPSPAAPVQPLPAASAHATIYVKDLDHLAALVKKDSLVSPMADELVTRRNAALAVGIVGSAAGLVVSTLGFYTFTSESCYDDKITHPSSCTQLPNLAVVTGGLALTGLSLIVASLMRPGRGDILDVVNAWNPRHLDEPFTIEGGGPGLR